MQDLDLAAIVLGDPGRRRALAPESMPLDTNVRGFDARSVLVLALVVAMLAGVIGWATMGGSSPSTAGPSASEAKADAAREAAQAKAVEPTAAPAKPVVPVAPKGVDLAPARIETSKVNGSAIVRVSIANQGRTALGSTGAGVLVLLDGEQVGEDTIGAIDATSSTTTEISLGYCPSGAHSLAVVIDPRGQVPEADERDNASTQMVAFGC